MAIPNLANRITAAVHGATYGGGVALSRPQSFSIDEVMDWLISHAGGVLHRGQRVLNDYGIQAEVVFEKLATPLTKATAAGNDLFIVVADDASGTATITVADMVPDAVSMSGSNQSPITQRQKFDYVGTVVDGTAISVA